jgi:hypothetical protein
VNVRLYCSGCGSSFGPFSVDRRENGDLLTTDRAKARMFIEEWNGRLYYRFRCRCGATPKYRATGLVERLHLDEGAKVAI